MSEEEGEVQEISVKPKEEDDASLATPVKEKANDAPLRIDTAASAPVEFPRRRPGPLDLSTTFKPNIPAALPSALATARIIDDLSRVPYPDNIQSPKIELNINAKDGKFRYDRDFLLQFMSICKEKPDMLPPLDAIGIGPVDQHTMARTNSRGGTHRPGRTPSISGPSGGSNTPGFPGFGQKAIPSGGMGNFVPGPKLSSQERYEMASGARAASVSSIGSPFNRMPPMTRSTSQSGAGSQLGGSKRTRSKRGEARDKNQGSQLAQGSNSRDNQSIFENPPPLQATANRWDRKAVSAVDPDSPELVDRKVKGLLNKLTMEKFDSISDQIIEWANKSEKEKDGRTLIQVIRLVFEKATDEATWSEMYARLCRKMMEQISPKVQDDGIKNAEGKPIAGGQLFRKYLLNRCQEDFERGWVAKEATAAAAATKAMEDKAAKAANEKSTEASAAGEQGDEIVLYSDEYYAAQKAKRQGLGLIKFIGELFKLQMLTERIMHECVKKLLGNVENPEEEEIESLCKLISTVGSLLDTQKARAHMDVYFSRMKELGKSNNVSSRMQFMLQDVIELRDRKWVARTQVAAPTTIAGVHEAAAKEKAIQDKEQYQRTMSMSRGGSRRGGERGEFPGPGADGWTNVASGNAPRPPPKAGDLSNFGKIASSKGLPMTFGPSSVFSGKKDNSKRESLSRASSNSNMFSMLSQTPDAAAEAGPKPAAEPAQRRRLILQPRTKPAEDQGTTTAEATPAGSDNSESEEEEAAPEMTKEDADKKIAEDAKEFFAVRNLDEAEVYFSALPAVHHYRLVEKLVGTAVEGKEALAQLVAELLTRVVSKELCSAEALEEGFVPLVEILEDIAIDAPKAPNNMALMMKAAFDSDQAARIAAKCTEPDNLIALLS
ncbi:armadillo-type protein [Mycena haematopus]|nr:armadillo-type protein [Mycena haematopus]